MTYRKFFSHKKDNTQKKGYSFRPGQFATKEIWGRFFPLALDGS